MITERNQGTHGTRRYDTIRYDTIPKRLRLRIRGYDAVIRVRARRRVLPYNSYREPAADRVWNGLKQRLYEDWSKNDWHSKVIYLFVSESVNLLRRRRRRPRLRRRLRQRRRQSSVLTKIKQQWAFSKEPDFGPLNRKPHRAPSAKSRETRGYYQPRTENQEPSSGIGSHRRSEFLLLAATTPKTDSVWWRKYEKEQK